MEGGLLVLVGRGCLVEDSGSDGGGENGALFKVDTKG